MRLKLSLLFLIVEDEDQALKDNSSEELPSPSQGTSATFFPPAARQLGTNIQKQTSSIQAFAAKDLSFSF